MRTVSCYAVESRGISRDACRASTVRRMRTVRRGTEGETRKDRSGIKRVGEGKGEKRRGNRRSERQFEGTMARIKCAAHGCCETLQQRTTWRGAFEGETERDGEHARMYSSRGEVMGAVIAG